jgi:hypothetical protein
MNEWEYVHMSLMGASLVSQAIAQILQTVSGAAHATPAYTVGAAGWASSPVAIVTYGGQNVGNASNAWASGFRELAGILQTGASISAVLGGYWRRSDEWKLQEDLAEKELEQIEKQILAAEIRLAIAELDLKNHEKQIENAKEVETFMRDKFTNWELYNWMVSQISTIFFQSYQMAYDLAKRAERAYQHELGFSDSNFIQFGYWDSLKKGLLAGERLHYDLKRMEMAYIDQNKREFEVTKHISLAMLDPVALLMLKETGECFVNLPEAIFDLDFPGHYMRRIKSVSLTIPCVAGPYTSVNCTLTLMKHSIRVENNLSESSLREKLGAVQSIATSSGQNDSGLFELNFRDERYLPFEGSGVISQWRLELSGKWRGESTPTDPAGERIDLTQFDFNTISDIIFHIRYSAKDSGNRFKQGVVSNLESSIEIMPLGDPDSPRLGLYRYFSARHEFPNEWHQFLHPVESATSQDLEIKLTRERFKFLFRNKKINTSNLELFLNLKDGIESSEGDGVQFVLTHPGGTTPPITLNPVAEFGGLLHAEQTLSNTLDSTSPELTWSLEVISSSVPTTLMLEGTNRLNPAVIENLGIVCRYSVDEDE